MKKLDIDKSFIVNTQFIAMYFPDWVFTKQDKNLEWLFYKQYNVIDANVSFFSSKTFLDFKRVYILFPYRYLQFDIYETANMEELRAYLLSDAVSNDYIDMYIVRYDFKYCIKYGKAEHHKRDVFVQNTETVD